MKKITFALLTAFTLALSPAVFAQHHGGNTVSDAKKITDAMSAAPAIIGKNATILDWPAKPGDAPKRLREGTNGWVCYPSMTPISRDPMCLDKQWQMLITALLSKTKPNLTGPGVAYMLQGDTGVSNTDPYDMAVPTATNNWVSSPPHIMLAYPDPKMLDGFPTDPNTGGPWVMWKGTAYEHLMVPVSRTQVAKMKK